MIDQAIILAAGLGTRMQPITNTIPKPLVKIDGKTLIDHKLDAARRAGIRKIIVNVHHLAEQLEEHLEKIHDLEIIISNERKLLMDSGGGITKALVHFDNRPFVVLNSDTFWHADEPANLLFLGENWNGDEMDILMGLADVEKAVGFHGAGDFFKSADGCLTRRGKHSSAPYAFCGDYITHPDVFQNSPTAPFSSNTLFDEAISKHRLKGKLLKGLWLHVGTPESIGEAERAIAHFPT